MTHPRRPHPSAHPRASRAACLCVGFGAGLMLGNHFWLCSTPRPSGRILRRHPRRGVCVTGLFNGRFDPPNLPAPVGGSGRCMHPGSRRVRFRSARRRSGVLVDERKHRVILYSLFCILYSVFFILYSVFCILYSSFDTGFDFDRCPRAVRARCQPPPRWPRGRGGPGTRRVGMYTP